VREIKRVWITMRKLEEIIDEIKSAARLRQIRPETAAKVYINQVNENIRNGHTGNYAFTRAIQTTYDWMRQEEQQKTYGGKA